MIPKRELLIRRHLELKDGGVFGEIYIRPGLPYRKIVNGRQRKAVGRFSLVKSGMVAQEWESMGVELPMLELCEVATPVHTIAAQPHGLFMKLVGRRKRLEYDPDLELEVDVGFALDVAGGTPFATAVKNWRPGRSKALATLVVEMKADDDKRNDDDEYQDKLRLAKQVYEGMGRFFITVMRSSGLEAAGIARSVHEIVLDHTAAVTSHDIRAVSRCFKVEGRRLETVSLDNVQRALGYGPEGTAKSAALHVRRIISIELEHGLAPHTPVRLVNDGRAIFERVGAR